MRPKQITSSGCSRIRSGVNVCPACDAYALGADTIHPWARKEFETTSNVESLGAALSAGSPINVGAPFRRRRFTHTRCFLGLYAALVSWAKGVLSHPELSRWVSRVVGVMFICFGAAILTMRRQAA